MAEIAAEKPKVKSSDAFRLLCSIAEELFPGPVTPIGPDSLLIKAWLSAASQESKCDSKQLISDLKQGPFGVEGMVMQRTQRPLPRSKWCASISRGAQNPYYGGYTGSVSLHRDCRLEMDPSTPASAAVCRMRDLILQCFGTVLQGVESSLALNHSIVTEYKDGCISRFRPVAN